MTRAALGPRKDSGVFLVGFMAAEVDKEVGRGSKRSRLLLLARLAWDGIEEVIPPSPVEQIAEVKKVFLFEWTKLGRNIKTFLRK